MPISSGELLAEQQEESGGELNRSLQILIVDDQKEVLETASLMLERLGHECLLASDPLLAMERIATNYEHLDLVITDYSMPNMNGLELATACAREFPDLKVILSTGYGDALPRELQLANGRVLSILHKPYSFKDLEQIVERVINDSA